jgi:FKBP-type peptidyl-prolyl cis-trans isomerase 2
MPVKKGDKVKIEYEGTFDDGTVFDSSEKHGQPLEFEIGKGQVIPGFENAIIGMEKGKEKKIKIKPADAYGEYREEMKKDIPRSVFPEEMKLEPGKVVGLQTPDGMRIGAVIKEANADKVVVDLNHPMAGKTLNFRIKVLEIAS